jgi:hypothetical protein
LPVRGFGRRPRAGFKHYRVNMSKTSVDVVVNVPSISSINVANNSTASKPLADTSEIFTLSSYYSHDLAIAVITESMGKSW